MRGAPEVLSACNEGEDTAQRRRIRSKVERAMGCCGEFAEFREFRESGEYVLSQHSALQDRAERCLNN